MRPAFLLGVAAPSGTDIASLALVIVAVAGLALFASGRRRSAPGSVGIAMPPPSTALLAAQFRRLNRLTSLALVFAGIALLGSAIVVGLRAVESHSEADSAVSGAQTEPTLIVIGRGAAPLIPDTAAVVIGIDGAWTTVEESTQRIDAAISAASAAGITAADVRTIDYRVTPVQAVGTDGVPTAMEGVQVSRRVGLIVRDLSQLDAVLASVTQAGVTVFGVALAVGNPDAAMAAARDNAVADARSRANQLAASLGVTILHSEETVELNASPPPPSPLALAVADPSTAPPSPSGEVRVEVQITYSVYAGIGVGS